MAEAQKSPNSDHVGASPNFTGFPPLAEETPRPLTVLHQHFSSGARTRWHSHHRPELLHATGGLLVLTTEQGAWTAPAGHALIIAPNVPHELAAYGCTEMRAAFLAGEALAVGTAIGASASSPTAATQCRVIGVSELLDVCLRRLADGPLLYDIDGRGGHLAALAMEEIRHAPEMRIALPLPRSVRLRQLGRELIQNPALGFDLDGWSDKIGVSRSTFTRRFRAETGLSFAEWRRRLRLLHALTLRAGGAPLHDAAKLTGYRSTNALRDMMRRAMADTMSTAASADADLRREVSH